MKHLLQHELNFLRETFQPEFVLVVRGFHTPELSFSNRADVKRMKTRAEINKKFYEIQVLFSSVNLRLKETTMISGGKNCLSPAGRKRCSI